MNKKYKVSMFCLYVKTKDGKIVLYNSLRGIESIKILEDADKVIPWLKRGKEYNYCNNREFKWLLENKYMVEDCMNEKAIRDSKKAKLLEQRYLYITIHVTSNCNFRCVYCSNTFDKKSMNIKTQDNIINMVKRNMHKYSGIYVSWFGGEPLLEMDVIEYMSQKLISICKNNKKAYSAEITTNGYLLTNENVKRLLLYKIREICVTLDGSEKEHNNMRRLVGGGETYQFVLNNLVNIKKSISNRSLNVVIRVNLMRESLLQFGQFYNQLNEVLGNDKRFSIYIKIVRNWGGEQMKEMEHLLITDAEYNVVHAQYMKKIKDIHILGYFNKLKFGGLSCMAMWRNSIVVFTDGSLSKCEKEDCNYVIGNINNEGHIYDEDSLDTWNGIAYRLVEKCDDCSLSTLCFGNTCPKEKILFSATECDIEFENVYESLKIFALISERGKENAD